MARKISFTFNAAGVTAIAELLEKDAPETCEAIWKALETPAENKGTLASFAGRELNIPLPDENKVFKGEDVPPENQTVFPLPGEVLWHYFPPHSEVGVHDQVYNVSVIYGRDTRMFLPTGWVPHNVFARIVENLDGLVEMCRRTKLEGPKVITIQRVED